MFKIIGSILVVTVLAAASNSTGDVDGAWAATWESSVLSAGMDTDLPHDCYGCNNLGDPAEAHWTFLEVIEHNQDFGEAPGEEEQAHFGEEDGDCNSTHGDCLESAPAPDALEELQLAMLAGSADGVRGVLSEYPEVITLNEERGAIQVAGCNGTIVGHLPLNAAQLSELAEVE